MKPAMRQYMNDIVSLTIMLLMTMALVAGEADATVRDKVHRETGYAVATISACLDDMLINAIHKVIEIRLDIDD